MKKLMAVLLLASLCVSLCACDSINYQKAQAAYDAENYKEAYDLFSALGDYKYSADMAKKARYMIACEYMDDGDYEEAIEIFESLGDFKDCPERIDTCRITQIDALLQGTWSSLLFGVAERRDVFHDGRYSAKLSINDSAIENEGSYRIAPEENGIYVCFDYTYNGDGSKSLNAEEQLQFTYTLENGSLVLTDTTDHTFTKE